MITAYITNGPETMFQQRDLEHDDCNRASRPAVIRISPEVRHQRIDGFGASFTDASAYLIGKVLTAQERDRAMTALFDHESGIGLSALRNPMGACDYARSIYSYDDMPWGRTDEGLEHFSIKHDLESIIPLTRQAMHINPDIMLITSPWSAPGWMKTSRSMKGGSLKPKYYAAYARYFVRYIEECQRHHVPVNAVTVQNEPLYEPKHYPSMFMPATQEAEFVREYLAPALHEAGLNTKILGYDHNWDKPEYPNEILEQAPQCFDGIAWHWYGGRPQAQSRVAQANPGADMYFTEGSGGSWIPEFEPAFSNLMRMCIASMRNGAKTFILWNIALDQNNGPTVPRFGRSTCRGLLRVDTTTKRAMSTLDYYGLAHFSKFVRSGASLIDSTQTSSVKSAAFLNEDGSMVCVLFNDSNVTCSVEISIDARHPDGHDHGAQGQEAVFNTHTVDAQTFGNKPQENPGHSCEYDSGNLTTFELRAKAACTLVWDNSNTENGEIVTTKETR